MEFTISPQKQYERNRISSDSVNTGYYSASYNVAKIVSPVSPFFAFVANIAFLGCNPINTGRSSDCREARSNLEANFDFPSKRLLVAFYPPRANTQNAREKCVEQLMEYRNNAENWTRWGQDESSGAFFLADFVPDIPDESLASHAAIKLQMSPLRIRISWNLEIFLE